MNRAQCPHCFTVFLISDEQMRISKGAVRCGTCRERFTVAPFDSKTAGEFKLEDPFLEPLTEEQKARPKVIDKPITGFKLKEKTNDDRIETSTDRQYELEIGDTSSNPSENELIDQVDQLISDKLVQDTEDTEQETVSENDLSANEETSINNEFTADEKPLAGKEPSASKEPSADTEPTTEDQSSLEQASLPEILAAIDTDDDIEFDLLDHNNKKPGKRFTRWLLNTLLLTLLIALIIALVYQLWFKQLVVLNDNSESELLINQSVDFSNQQLKQFDLQLPQRRNLNKLTLVSAQTEAHPGRASTILLRVSILNRAEIAQPLPWLELSLNNADGNIIARRSINPETYLHNNRSINQIRANELKKVTIELLSFPKQATGYELKIINK